MTENKLPTDKLILLGWGLVLACVLDISANNGDPLEFLWFCSFSCLVLAVAVFRRSALLASMILILAVPAQFLWIVDFFLNLTGHGLGRSEMIWGGGPFVVVTSFITHTVLIPSAFYAVFRLGFDRRAFWPAVLYGFVLLSVSFILTEPFLNHNCVLFSCDAADPGQGYVRHFWGMLLYWFILLWISMKVFCLGFDYWDKRKNCRGGSGHAGNA